MTERSRSNKRSQTVAETELETGAFSQTNLKQTGQNEEPISTCAWKWLSVWQRRFGCPLCFWEHERLSHKTSSKSTIHGRIPVIAFRLDYPWSPEDDPAFSCPKVSNLDSSSSPLLGCVLKTIAFRRGVSFPARLASSLRWQLSFPPSGKELFPSGGKSAAVIVNRIRAWQVRHASSRDFWR